MKKKKMVLIFIVFVVICCTFNVYADGNVPTCEGIFGKELLAEIKSILGIIQIVAPIILLLLTSLDFAKVIFSDSKDGLDKAKNNFLKRGVAVLIIFFAPFIINLILDLVNETTAQSCIPVITEQQ